MRKTNCYVYFFYDSEDNLLYIGKSMSVMNRLRNHFSKKELITNPWKSTIDKQKVVLYECQNSTDLDVYETYFINKYKPKHNVDKIYHYPLSFEPPYIEPKILLQKPVSMLTIYLKGTEEEQKALLSWWKTPRDPERDYIEEEETERCLDFSYYLMIKGKE